MSSALTTTEQINRSLEPKRVDQFYVKFLNLPENISNILGRQVQSISRPDLTLKDFELFHKNKRRPNHATLDFSDVSCTLLDDDQSLCTKALYDQISRQLGTRGQDPEDAFEDARFEVKVEVYSASGNVVEAFTLKQAFISNITHSEQVYTDSESNNIITITLTYEDVAYDFDF